MFFRVPKDVPVAPEILQRVVHKTVEPLLTGDWSKHSGNLYKIIGQDKVNKNYHHQHATSMLSRFGHLEGIMIFFQFFSWIDNIDFEQLRVSSEIF